MVVYEKNIFITIIFITDNEPTLEFVYFTEGWPWLSLTSVNYDSMFLIGGCFCSLIFSEFSVNIP